MEHSPADAARRVLTTAAVTGAALALSAAAALPALAGHGHSDAGHHYGAAHHGSTQAAQAQSTHPPHGAQAGNKPGNPKSGGANSGAAKSNAARSGVLAHSSKPQSADPSSVNGPPGNNGHVFIKQSATDQSQGNVPHVTCDLAVAFFGFDRNQALTLSLDGQAPSGSGHVGDGSFTVPSDVSTTGSTYDGSLAFSTGDLDVSGLTAKKQGYHIRLTVTTNQPGGHKYKVFWLQPCDQASSDEATQPAVTWAQGSTSSGAVADSARATRVLAVTVPNAAFAQPAAAASSGSTADAASLPFTGAEIGLMSVAGASAIGVGTALLAATRRRRRSVTPR